MAGGTERCEFPLSRPCDQWIVLCCPESCMQHGWLVTPHARSRDHAFF